MIIRNCLAMVVLMCAQSLVASEMPETQRIPFKLVSRLPTIEARISGHPVSLFLDLGAYKSLALTTKALKGIPVTFTGQSETYRDSTGQTHTKRVFVTDELAADGFKVSGLDGVEFSYPSGSGDFSQDGYLGLGFLRRYFLVFDYEHSVLKLYPLGSSGTSTRAACGDGSPFRIDLSKGVVETKIDTEKGSFVFQLDTGSTENVLRPSAVGLPVDTKQTSFAFMKFNLSHYKAARTRFPLREFAAPDVDGVLGTDFFESRVICLDPDKQLAWIK
jgi:hypothetical protein